MNIPIIKNIIFHFLILSFFLKIFWAKNKNKTHAQVSELIPSRTISAIQNKRVKLGLFPPSDNWTSKELEYLIINYGSEDKNTISKYLKRSSSAIMTKANEIGISRKSEHWNSSEIELLVNNNNKSVEDISFIILTKTKTQIIYKRNHLKKIDVIMDEEDISKTTPYHKESKHNRLLSILDNINVGESFEITRNDYTYYFMQCKKVLVDKIFKSKITHKDHPIIRRIWRLN